jgi:ABC-type Na+ efflux pump permease subunit
MRPRKLWRVARWEVEKSAGGVGRQTVAIAVVAVLGAGVVAALALSGTAGLETGIYRVGVSEDSAYYGPAASNPTFDVREPDRRALDRGEQELYFGPTGLVDRLRTAKGDAALEAFRATVGRYNDRLMDAEPNRTAAYPVSVSLSYAEQTGGGVTLGTDDGSGSRDDDGDDGSAGGDGTDGGSGEVDLGGNGDADGGSGDGGVGDVSGLGTGLTGGGMSGSPSDISPPFPFESLVLAFLFVVPLNFVIQAYGSSMLSERLNRRGELMLVSPVTRTDIIAGKTLPYLLGTVAIVTGITAALRFGGLSASGGPIAVLALVPLALLFLAATFCGAMFARSFKELTFLTVTITVALTSYAFVPAIFTEVTPIALISPLTIVVRDLQGEAISLAEFAFSTVPPTLTAFVLFGLGAGLYREEDLFTQRPIPLKVLDALAGQITSKYSAMKLSALLLPFVFVAELVAIALLFALGEVSIVLVIAAVAVIEEVPKSLHLYAGYVHARYERTIRAALALGALSGLGFFLAEKFVLIARLADLQSIPTGRAALVTGLLPEGVPLAVVLALALLTPLALHVVTASISALGARRNRRAYAVALLGAIVVHFAYNLAVVRFLVR